MQSDGIWLKIDGFVYKIYLFLLGVMMYNDFIMTRTEELQ